MLPAARRAHADETSDLRALVEAQAAEIRILKQRLDTLEAQAVLPAPQPGVAAAPILELPARMTEAQKPPPPVTVRWSGAPEFVSADGRLRFRPRGRVYADASWTGGSDSAARNISGSELRALWIGFEGQVDKFNYILTADLANNDVAVRSAYVAWRDPTPAGDLEITLGNRLSERGLEGSSSSEGAPFMERNAVALALSPMKGLYGLGITAKLFGDGWHVAAQVAGDDINNNLGTSSDTITTMIRAHWNPVRGDGGTLHLGAWGFHEAFSSGVNRLARNTPWSGGHFNDNLVVPMGAIDDPSTASGWGLEVGAVSGRFWSFAEYGERRIDARAVTATVNAWNLSAGWMLTDDRPGYAARSGTWVRSRPRRPLSEGGIGTVELVGRIQRLDNADVALGGVGEEATLGLNWKPEEWLRLMLNASLWRTETSSGAYAGKDAGQAVNTRLQVSF